MPPVLSAIASYGRAALAQTVAGDLLREPERTAVLVVDNQGDYTAAHGEEVLRPGRNLGWLGACNLALEQGFERGHEFVLLMNNDTRLSDGFVAGLLAAHAAQPALLAPVYDDDSVPAQRSTHAGDAATYVPHPEERLVAVVDGTALLVSRAAYEALGPMDAKRFGRHGWGAMEDWCLLARQRGFPVAVTDRAYVSHPRAVTAKAVNVRYTTFAAAEMHYGLVRKWGRAWPLALPGSGHEPMPLGELAYLSAFHLLEVAGLADRLQRPPSAA